MNNAQLTDILALTDALLEAGWCQLDEARWREPTAYPTEHCLLGAVLVAAVEVVGDWQQLPGGRRAVMALLAAGVPDRCSCCSAKAAITSYNDGSYRTVDEVRALVHTAAERLTK